MSSSSLEWNEALVLFDGHQISVDFVEHTQSGVSPPIFKTSPVHGAEHITHITHITGTPEQDI